MEQDLVHSLNMIFGQVLRLNFTAMHLNLEKLGVQPGQIPLLISLLKQDGVSQKKLADANFVKPPTVAVMLKRMEKNGLIQRRQDNEDQRIMRVFITEKGKSTVDEVRELMISMQDAMYQGFTQEEKVLMRRFCLQMKENLIKMCYLDREKLGRFDLLEDEIGRCLSMGQEKS